MRGGQTDRHTGGQTEQIVGRVEGISVDRDSTIVHGPAVRAVATSDRLDQKLRLNARAPCDPRGFHESKSSTEESLLRLFGVSVYLSVSLSLFLPFGV